MSALGYIYAIESGGTVKIGWSSDPRRRLSKLNSDTSSPGRLLGYFPGTRDEEAALHQRFAHLQTHREWFRRSGEVADFLANLPPLVPKAKPPWKPRKPDKRTLGRPPKPPRAPRYSALRQRLSAELKTVSAAFSGGEVPTDYRTLGARMAASPDGRARRPDGRAMRQSYGLPTLFMSIHWPAGAMWPDGIERPEPIVTKELMRDIKHHQVMLRWEREASARAFLKSAISALCKAHSEAA